DSPAANALGEVVWSQYDPASGYSQIFSSSRGQLTSDSTNHTAPSINKYGDVVWSQNDGIYGIIDGRAIRLIYDTNSYSPVISDNGEIAYVSGWSRIVSTVRGVLYTGSYPGGLGMNNLGDLVWIENGGQIYSLPHGTTAPVQLTNDSAWHGSASINDSGEVVWDQWTPTGSRIFSSTRGELTFTCPVADNHVWPKITNCGTVVFTAWNNNGEKVVYRLGSAAACIEPPTASLCGQAGSPQVISPGSTQQDSPAANALGEVVWSQYDPASGYSQIYSSSRGQLTSDSTNHTAPSINKYGDVVWTSWMQWGPNNGIYGIINGRAIQLISDDTANSPVINDNGEIAYIIRDNQTYAYQIRSTVRGVLYTGSYPGGLGMNNLGDLVWIENGGQIYSLPHGTTAPVQLTNDS